MRSALLALSILPLLAAAQARTGAFVIAATPVEAVGADSAGAFESIVPVDEEIEWQLVVPEEYDPQRPPGLIVYISPSDSGALPRDWLGLPQARNFIWIAADDSGNRQDVSRRISYALFAVGLAGSRYKLDAGRVYLSGFSGGARVAGLVAAAYPQLFRGYIFIGGAEPWETEPAPEVLRRMRANRYIFIVGSDDPNRRMALRVADGYAAAGIEQVETTIISRRGHDLPPEEDMAEALDFLDGSADE